MVDRVYKSGIPELRRSIQALWAEFARLDPKTDWVRLRVDPVLRHAAALERLLTSGRFSKEVSRLNKGVVLFHSDLVYLRTNLQGLRALLESERRRRRATGVRTR